MNNKALDVVGVPLSSGVGKHDFVERDTPQGGGESGHVVVQEISQQKAVRDDRGFASIIEKVSLMDNIDLDKLEKMMAMQLQWEQRDSDRKLQEALVEISKRLAHLRIVKKNPVYYGEGTNKQEVFRYAKIEEIDKIVRPILNEFGITISYDIEPNSIPGWHTAVARASLGVSKIESRLPLPLDTHSKRSGPQNMGSTQTYGQRRALCALLNIVVENQDDDGMGGAVDAAQAENIKELIRESGVDVAGFLKYMKAASADEILFRDYRKATSTLEERIAKNKVAAGKNAKA